jgi:hypothetical protein
MTTEVYFSSKVQHAETWKALRAALLPLGIHSCCRWVDWEGNLQTNKPSTDQWRRHWENIVADVAACDVLVFMSLEQERACSGLIEVGIALAHQKPVLLVSPHWWSFSTLPNVRRFVTLESAIEVLVAMAAGKHARLLERAA